jgi:hypothetical protein
MMDRGADTNTYAQQALPPRPAPRLNVASVVAPISGVLVGCVVFYVLDNQFNWWAGQAVDAGIRTLAWFVAIGFVCAFVALARGEKWWGVTAFGLIMNGVLLVAFVQKNYSLWPGLWPEP